MANLDVNDVLLDPDLSTIFNVKRRQESVGLKGRTIITEELIEDIVGVITWVKGDIARREDGTIVQEGIQCVTPFSLRDNSFGFQADIIVWNGTEYLITMTKPYRHIGRGFTRAMAESIRATDNPPTMENTP